VAFRHRFVDKHSRTHDKMVQAARSGVPKMAEGSMASATSKKADLKLTSVARASLEELLVDFGRSAALLVGPIRPVRQV